MFAVLLLLLWLSFYILFIRSKSPYVNIMKATTLMAAGKPEQTKDGLHYSRFILKAVCFLTLTKIINELYKNYFLKHKHKEIFLYFCLNRFYL